MCQLQNDFGAVVVLEAKLAIAAQSHQYKRHSIAFAGLDGTTKRERMNQNGCVVCQLWDNLDGVYLEDILIFYKDMIEINIDIALEALFREKTAKSGDYDSLHYLTCVLSEEKTQV